MIARHSNCLTWRSARLIQRQSINLSVRRDKDLWPPEHSLSSLSYLIATNCTSEAKRLDCFSTLAITSP